MKVVGEVSFDGTIIDLIFNGRGLRRTDDNMGNDNATYHNYHWRGLERRDWRNTSADGNVLAYNWRANDPGDMVRVITSASVPEPGMIGLFSIGLVALVMTRRKKTLL